jgi:hypothetical protein
LLITKSSDTYGRHMETLLGEWGWGSCRVCFKNLPSLYTSSITLNIS